MPDGALDKFTRFLSTAEKALSSTPARADGELCLVHGASASLSQLVSTLESADEFAELCQAIRQSGATGFGAHGWNHAIGNWFRRSGLCQRIAAGEPLPDAHILFENLRSELSRTEHVVTHLALIEYVSFHQKRLDFGRYEIVRFTPNELEALLQSEIRAAFYPWSVVPTSGLSNYFKELYRFRSELVHGAAPGKVVLTQHLFEARQFARRLLRWFVRFLVDVQAHAERTGSSAQLPKRSDILRLLDLEAEGVRKARWLLPALPAEFPGYPDLA